MEIHEVMTINPTATKPSEPSIFMEINTTKHTIAKLNIKPNMDKL